MLHFEDNLSILILLAFVCITFLQSSLDKVLNWKDNLQWLKGHFEKIIFGKMVPVLLLVLTLTELTAGVLGIWGIMDIIHYNQYQMGLNAAVVAGIALLMLLLGQRLNKDYDGARTVVIYLVPVAILIFLLEMSRW